MRKQSKALLHIGLAYLAVSIVLDYFLGVYQVLLWPALAVTFVLFGLIIFNTFWEQHVPSETHDRGRSVSQIEDELTRLEHLCNDAITQADPATEEILSERIRAVVFAAAVNILNTTETALRNIVLEQPDLLRAQISDSQLFEVLTAKGSIIRSGDRESLEFLLEKIEDWTT